MTMTFEEAIDEQIKFLEQVVELYIVELADDIVDNTVFNSGKLKNNTNISFNKEDMSTNRAPDPSGSGAKSDARSRSKEYNLGDDIVINNGMPYAVVTEVGDKNRSPNAFVGRAIEQFDPQMKRAVAKIK